MKRKLFTLLMLLVSVFAVVAISGVKEADAANIKNGTYVYFEMPSDWTGSVSFMVGHNTYSQGYNMTKISNTNIYYVSMPAWSGYTEYAFFNVSGWGGEGSNLTHRKQYCGKETAIMKTTFYEVKENYNLFANNASDKNSEGTQYGATYGELNVPIKVTSNVGGSVSASGMQLTSATKAESNQGTSINVIKYTAATLTATPTAGYNFVGWYNGDTEISKEATYTVDNVVDALTYTAKFEFDTTPLKTLLSDFYNDGVYNRHTVINLNDEAKGEIAQYFHNVGESYSNLQVERNTTFCGNYLYFNEGNKTGFGTNADGKLTQFTWNGSYEDNGVGKNAIDPYFVTLKDFADLVNNSSNAGADGVVLSKGRSCDENGVYMDICCQCNTKQKKKK